MCTCMVLLTSFDFSECEISLSYDFLKRLFSFFSLFKKGFLLLIPWEILDFLYLSEKFPNNHFP